MIQRYAIASIAAVLVAVAAYAAPGASSAADDSKQVGSTQSKNMRLQNAKAGGASVQNTIAKMDADGDGNVTKDEAVSYADARFAKMDVDGNGKVDADDRQARAKARFAEMDADRNGAVTEAEFVSSADAKAALRKLKSTDKSESTASYERNSGGKQGGISSGNNASNNSANNKASNNPGKWGRADTNSDNAISRSEYDAATLARFATRDKDGNGMLSGEEMNTGRKKVSGRYGKVGAG